MPFFHFQPRRNKGVRMSASFPETGVARMPSLLESLSARDRCDTRSAQPLCETGITLLPCRINGLRDEKCRVSAGLRTELLHTSRVNFRDVQVSILIDAQAMHTPQTAWERAHTAPGVQQVTLQVPLDHLVRGAVKGPDRFAGPYVQQVET